MNEARSVTATFAKVPVPSSTGAVAVAGTARVRGGKAFVGAVCNEPASCRGSLKLLARLRSSKGSHRRARKSVAIGRTTFSLAPGSSTTLEVRLSFRARQLLENAGHLKATVTGAGIHPHPVRLRPAR